MSLLITTGIIALFFGIIAIFSRELLQYLGHNLNKPVVYLDDKLQALRLPVGLVLALAGLWLVSVAFRYGELWPLHLVGIIALFFGLCYLFVPQWLELLRKFLDQTLLAADEILVGARKAVGVFLILAAIYIFVSLLLMGR